MALAIIAAWELFEPRIDTMPMSFSFGNSANITAVTSSAIKMECSGITRSTCLSAVIPNILANTRLPISSTSTARSRM